MNASRTRASIQFGHVRLTSEGAGRSSPTASGGGSHGQGDSHGQGSVHGQGDAHGQGSGVGVLTQTPASGVVSASSALAAAFFAVALAGGTSGAGGGDPGTNTALSQWVQQIVPLSFTTVQGTWATTQESLSIPPAFTSNSGAPVQNDAISWPVVLTAGTWTLQVWYSLNSSGGIATFAFDGTSIGTIDSYNVAHVAGQLTALTNIAVAADSKKTLSLTVATKNASSSGFRFNLEYLTLTRTA